MTRVLILTAHPNPGYSRINQRLSAMATSLSGVTVVDLYALYPSFKIDVGLEQQRLKEHDVIVFQFPVYWYSTPALLKEWQDLVLEYGFAYGDGGSYLANKLCLLAITAGGAELAYCADGANRFPIRTLLSPLEQMAGLCQMKFLPPLVLFSSHVAAKDARAEQHVAKYKQVLEALRDDQLDLPKVFEQNLLGMPMIPLLSGKGDTGGQSHG
ncbi:NAD(P)H-dependent oxidoreductase [Granulosicoccus antarcticus]|uniref:General stress protein 14 n=1 Tax=Granulosicoccus antarcticus IMCC3135 TaxID=1192854 RepID=A0A2Z2NX36_9GAMM|nr:NAD(P)H-dependent oxidoreductase [Granulosicoccus antarcticus]ASJ76006.1 General stress protein 14 [Granulosicoccus antarcticus IMCC3135]